MTVDLNLTVDCILAAVRKHPDYNLVKNAHPAALIFWAKEIVYLDSICSDIVDEADLSRAAALVIDAVANDIGVQQSDIFGDSFAAFAYRQPVSRISA
jgi:hypothetical protein